jgi:two-component system, OmpR family, sensor histidine kinase QseC
LRSIKVFLTLTLLSVAALLNFAAALRGYHRGMLEAEQLFNQRMYQHLDLLNYSLPDLLSRGDIQAGHLRYPARALTAETHLEFQWATPDGRLLARSEAMPEAPVTELTEGFRFENFSGYRWHVLAAPSADGKSWFVLAERDDQRYRMAESVILPAVYPMLIAVPVLGAIIWLLLGMGLRPVSKLARDLGLREATDLHALPAEGLPRELQPLASSANALLRRLEASFARERRFSADAAHELRTPIAALRIQAENLGVAAPAHADSVAKLQAGIERLSHLIDQILILNRVAPDQYMGRFESIALDAAVRRVIAEQGDALQRRSLDIELLGSGATVSGDAFALDSLLSNLIGNAIKYTPHGGRIRVVTSVEHGDVILDVMDDGEGIAPDQRERVFDRFYRADGDRNDAGVSGCGLGLSIVKQVADLHGARVELRDSSFGRGLWVRVAFRGATHATR